ncbi:MAG: hypothetical protein ACYS8W_17320 [Planctomycetota bacterium]|jgi:hypothetical protein
MNKEILHELKLIKKLLAIQAVKGKTYREKVLILNSLGFGPKEIAEFLGKTPNAISLVLHEAKKTKRRKNSNG